MFVRFSSVGAALALIAGGGLLAACSENPVDPDHTANHADAFGIVLRVDGDTLYAYSATDGSVSCTASPCGIVVYLGVPSHSIDVVILDRLGSPIPVGDLTEHFEFQTLVADTTVARASVYTETPEHRLEVAGLRVGSTRMRLAILHEGEHEDFGTPPLEDDRALQIRVAE